MGYDLIEALDYLDPALCSYTEWTAVGMALKHEGHDCSVWEQWSAGDPARFKSGECAEKWATFGRTDGNIVTGGTIVELAKQKGGLDNRGHALDFDSEITSDNSDLLQGKRLTDDRYLEPEDLPKVTDWNPGEQLITYLKTLFNPGEFVGYVMEAYDHDGRMVPSRGAYDRTMEQLVADIERYSGDLGAALGDYRDEVGAWIRFNPLDGEGVKDANVTDYRYALIESDSMTPGEQLAKIHALNLPVAAMVFSGGKSVHAIVKVDAPDFTEYRKRVDFLFRFCEHEGLRMDKQNRNPSRLSRMPGVTRMGRKQYLIETNTGAESWAAWLDYIEGVKDDLPDVENFAAKMDDLPELAEPLIEGILRKGHKMLLAGPSKAGKSYALIELCIAIAEGREWLGFRCTQGRVLYINLEVDRASCLHRFADVYDAMGSDKAHAANIDIWNLRGRSVPMDKLAPKIIRRAKDKGYAAVIIDPIYKVITGDENNASEMGAFCNQFDKVCTELKCAVIYCHHHSKGLQGDKRSMDRASGSGVFARDPDALVDMIELDLKKNILEGLMNSAEEKLIVSRLDQLKLGWDDDLDGRAGLQEARNRANTLLSSAELETLDADIEEARTLATAKTAWRIEATLREFPHRPPLNVWFDFPLHYKDNTGELVNIQVGMAQQMRGEDSPNSENKMEPLYRAALEAYDSLKENYKNGIVPYETWKTEADKLISRVDAKRKLPKEKRGRDKWHEFNHLKESKIDGQWFILEA